MVEFFATEIGCYEDLGVVSCGASNAKSTEEYHYINFQRPLDVDGRDDEGIYFEIGDQSQGGYNKIATCELIVKLIEPLGYMKNELIVVRFDTTASEGLSPIGDGLKKVFVGYDALLEIMP